MQPVYMPSSLYRELVDYLVRSVFDGALAGNHDMRDLVVNMLADRQLWPDYTRPDDELKS